MRTNGGETGAPGVAQLETEQRNAASSRLAELSTLERVTLINREDQTVALRVREALPEIADAVDLIVARAKQGGRLVYVGAGTSARLGVMDAAECQPTYGLNLVHCVMAGGRDAVFNPQEKLEDDAQQAHADLRTFGLRKEDVVVAATASGRTPYCVGALVYAAEIGAGRIGLSCNRPAALGRYAQISIEVDTGAEFIMGSTRMKAGTAQKMVMNMLSTATMIALGRTYQNLMVCLSASNGKISNRVIRLFEEACGREDPGHAREMLKRADGRLDLAVIMEIAGTTLVQARAAMEQSRGNLPQALEGLMRTG